MLLGGHVSVRMPWRDSSPWTRYLFHVFLQRLQRLKRSTFPRAAAAGRPAAQHEPSPAGPVAAAAKGELLREAPVPAAGVARLVAPEPEADSQRPAQSESAAAPGVLADAGADANAVAGESEKAASAAAAAATKRSLQMRSRILLESGDEQEDGAPSETFCPRSFLLDANCGDLGIDSAGPLAAAGRIIERLVTVLLRFPHLVAAPVLAHQDL